MIKNVNVESGSRNWVAFFYEVVMGKLRIYEIRTNYVDYLASFIPHLFHNKKSGQQNERKYIGIVLEVHDQKYKALLQREYRVITSLEDKICENARKLYEYKMEKGGSTPLAERCNDFRLLEEKAAEFISIVRSISK